jgi:hypothetical protein
MLMFGTAALRIPVAAIKPASEDEQGQAAASRLKVPPVSPLLHSSKF